MKKIKIFILDILIWAGIFILLSSLWIVLEIVFDGGVQKSISDSLISIIFVTIIWWQIKKWIVVKESEDVNKFAFDSQKGCRK